ncbi:MAG: hypothetical protein RIB84_16580 [Sneathiellaceae bacterium]
MPEQAMGRRASTRRLRLRNGLLAAAALAASWALGGAARAETETCPEDGVLPQQALRIGGTGDSQPDLLVTGLCKVDKLGEYMFGTVNVVQGGRLVFVEPPTPVDRTKNRTAFWAEAIVIENGGSVEAGTGSEKPYGSNGNVLEIILYGADPSGGKPLTVPGRGVACHQPECGVPADVWANGAAQPVALPGFAAGQKDYFYPYHALPYDGAPLADGKPGYFGAKVLALSYGGKLLLRGYKGAQGAAAADADPKATGSSWVRLGGHLEKGQSTLILDPPVTDWTAGDRIVVTGTDYLPNHSEEFTITKVAGATLTLDRPAGWHHNGAVFPLAARLQNASAGFKAANRGSPLLTSAETRAAVALMSRSIRIVSGGDSAGEVFDWESPAEKQAAVLAFGADSPRSRSATERDPSYQYGGHVIARQGFETLQVQGVEFRWLGQGGRMGHYPLHFHMARKVPDGTYVKDSTIHESMTRWIVLHATQGVTLQRNIGYRSIGHGFYLEDATETDNRLFANLGIFARGAVAGPDNPRNIPGILARTQDQSVGNTGSLAARARSDVIYPTAFWITNGWNDFVGNMAAGAGTCGACYWLVPAGPNGMMSPMKWSGYAGLQARPGYEGSSPLKQFYANHCSTAMHSFNAVGSSSPCAAVGSWSGGKMQNADRLVAVPSLAPAPTFPASADPYYPDMVDLRSPTVCTPPTVPGGADDCQTVPKCDYADPKTCGITVLDSYTTAFNWPETNLGAIWLRGGWNLVDRLFMSDVQNGGVGLISSGDYTRAAAPLGYWTMISQSVFVGESQPGTGFASAAGPKKPDGKTACTVPTASAPNTCLALDAGTGYPLSNWATNRKFNIYDGPAYQDGNAYLDIAVSPCDSVETCMYFGTLGVRKSPKDPKKGYLPNAAIGWKQPNGFYYPPAFHSANLFFDKVDIRHYLTVPLFQPGTYLADGKAIQREFLGGYPDQDIPHPAPVPENLFDGFTDIDRQTVLNDVDGSLTGFETTISVNQDPFFSAPVQTAECLSNQQVVPANGCAGKTEPYTPTARTSPYAHVTTVVYPACAANADTSHQSAEQQALCGSGAPGPNVGRGGTWSQDCTGPFCTGVRLYRQYLTSDGAGGNDREWQAWKAKGCDTPAKAGTAECDVPFIRMAGANEWQRNALTANNGIFYIDTTRSLEAQNSSKDILDAGGRPRSVNVFQPGGTYHVFLLFAPESTKQTYQIYTGAGFDPKAGVKGVRVSPETVSFRTAPWDLPAGWTVEMIAGADPAVKDVLQVSVDFGKLPKSINLDPATDAGTCKPASFCTRTGNSCGCSLKPGDSALLQFGSGLKQSCDAICKSWAVKDLDCPEGGCLGFSFTLPAAFKADDRNHRPPPKAFPTDQPDSPWKTTVLKAAMAADAGSCHYTPAQTPTLAGSCRPKD